MIRAERETEVQVEETYGTRSSAPRELVHQLHGYAGGVFPGPDFYPRLFERAPGGISQVIK